jgi:hypothetical protein
MRNRVTQVLSIVGRRFISAAVLFALASSIAASAQTTQTESRSAPSNGIDRDVLKSRLSIQSISRGSLGQSYCRRMCPVAE